MTKQERKLVNASFKAVKELITKCSLDPYYKGYLLMRINKVIKNTSSHFVVSNVTTDFAILFAWHQNITFDVEHEIEWCTIGIYLNKNEDYYKTQIEDSIDKINSI